MQQPFMKALARQAKIVVKEVADEVLIYDLHQHKAYCLNKTAALVWGYCDGETSAAEMARQMTDELRTPVREDVVWLALDELGRANLLQQRLVRPQTLARFSRRKALRQLAATLAVPLVTTIIAPKAVAAASTCQFSICQDKGSLVNDCGTCAKPGIVGTCYKNNGCGNGNVIRAGVSCTSCFSSGLDGSSWTCTSGC